MTNIATSIKDKKTLVQKTAFLLSLKSSLRESRILKDIAHLSINKEQVYNALMAQFIKKTEGLDKVNHRLLHMIWK